MCGTCGCGTNEHGVVIGHPREEHHHEHHHHHGEHYHDEDHHHHGHHHHDHHHHGHHHHTHASDTKGRILEIEKDILSANERQAAMNRGFFEAKNIFALNLVSSPGSGKTSLLERTLQDLKEEISFYVIEGDQQTQNDAKRIDALNIPVMQINTGKGCHLESDMVYEAVKKLSIKDNSVLMIENVGNLVCPSMFDLGESKRVVIISTTEGEDKPVKYPDMFYTADVCIINKIDLLPYLDFDMEQLKNYALQVNPKLKFFELSAKTGEGMVPWYEWMKEQINS